MISAAEPLASAPATTSAALPGADFWLIYTPGKILAAIAWRKGLTPHQTDLLKAMRPDFSENYTSFKTFGCAVYSDPIIAPAMLRNDTAYLITPCRFTP